MKHGVSVYFLLNIFLAIVVLAVSCHSGDRFEKYRNAVQFLNLHDTVSYVGMKECKKCHPLIYNQYMRTGMGLSFDTATCGKSAAVIGEDSMLYDPGLNMYYKPFWKDDALMLKEFRLNKGDTVFERIEKVDYVVGSGQHTNSHIYLSGNYAYQMPFTYYTQDGMFDFPPGFEEGNNSRFNRKVGLECMSCHNALPEFVMGSENKYTHIPDGIDCERCHGPGELHVQLKKQGFIVDTAREIDYTIVNPAHLSLKLQSDVCARCHLQGTMVLKPGKSFYDFRPGMELTEVLDIFMPVYKGGREDFIMASHYERMVQSRCFTESNGGFSCLGCHNPHVSYTETKKETFNRFCLSCHTGPAGGCSADEQKREKHDNDCTFCHMPESYTRDIPHVTIHDHNIAIPVDPDTDLDGRIFHGLAPINNPNTDNLTRARGYIKEFETFKPDPQYLDSAYYYLQRSGEIDQDVYFNAMINYWFLKRDFSSIVDFVETKGVLAVLDTVLNQKDYGNYDAWTSYRIGQSYENKNNVMVSGYFYKKAIELAPYNLEFQNKYGSHLASRGEWNEAVTIFAFIVDEDPDFTSGWVNLSLAYLRTNKPSKAEHASRKALEINPDHIRAIENLVAIYLKTNREEDALELIKRLEKLNSQHSIVLQYRSKL